MKYEQLDRLNDLRQKGAITEEEYQREKEKILGTTTYQSTGNLYGFDTNGYSMMIHLTQLFGLAIPLAGMIVPIVLWVLNKDNNPVIDKHGKIVTNWIITAIILYAIAGLFCIVLIGIPLLIVLFIANIIFIIQGGLKAKQGIYYKYPWSFEFIKVDDRLDLDRTI